MKEFEWDPSNVEMLKSELLDPQNGENTGDSMKQPKWSDLKLDKEGTLRMREEMARIQKIKITINLDSDVLDRIRNYANKKGTPYQRYLNALLRQAIKQKTEEESRLDRLEEEIIQLKKKLAA